MPSSPAPIATPDLLPSSQVTVHAWVDDVSEALHTVSISPNAPPKASRVAASAATELHGSVPLSVPLDAPLSKLRARPAAPGTKATTDRDGGDAVEELGRKLPRRDSLNRREALLKDRLLNNPWAQAPLPSDWEVQPTYRRHVVQYPYFLAPLWDARVEAERRKPPVTPKSKPGSGKGSLPTAAAAAAAVAVEIPAELRRRLKHARAAKGLLQDLEEQVRAFVAGWDKKRARRARDGLDDVDSADEDAGEVVFVGREGRMHDVPPSPTTGHQQQRTRKDTVSSNDSGSVIDLGYGSRRRLTDASISDGASLGGGNELELRREKLVFDSLVNDKGASFGRWLVHSIAEYYGLRTWSVTVGNPARREAYVGIETVSCGGSQATGIMPRPLWALV